MSDEDRAVAIVRQATRETQKAIKGRMGIVRCKTFRCLGILGEDGVWRDSHRRALEVLEVVTEFQ